MVKVCASDPESKTACEQQVRSANRCGQHAHVLVMRRRRASGRTAVIVQRGIGGNQRKSGEIGRGARQNAQAKKITNATEIAANEASGLYQSQNGSQ